jgi:outer membrane protein assembly factor BamB
MGRLVADERHGLVVAMTGVNPPNSEGSRKKMLRVLDAADGRLRWSRRFPVGTGTPALDDVRLMLISGPVLGRGRLLTFDLLTGVPGWSRPTEFSAEIGTGGVVDGDRVIVGDIGGTFYAVHRSTGRLSWKTDLTRLYLDGHPVVFGDTFVARDMSGEYHVFNRRTGRLRSRWLTIGSSVGYGVANGRFVHAQQGVGDSQVVAVPDEFRTARTPQRTDRGRERDDGRGRPATIEG